MDAPRFRPFLRHVIYINVNGNCTKDMPHRRRPLFTDIRRVRARTSPYIASSFFEFVGSLCNVVKTLFCMSIFCFGYHAVSFHRTLSTEGNVFVVTSFDNKNFQYFCVCVCVGISFRSF